MNIIKKIVGIFCLIECITTIILFFTESELQQHPVIVIIILLVFWMVSYKLLKPKKNNVTIPEVNHPQVQRITPSNSFVEHRIPQLERIINESYHIMYNTDNPETLCERYKFALDQMKELQKYSDDGYYDDLQKYSELLSDSNLCSLIVSCYNKYIEKASLELKREKSIQNRMSKFWKIIEENANYDVFLTAKNSCN